MSSQTSVADSYALLKILPSIIPELDQLASGNVEGGVMGQLSCTVDNDFKLLSLTVVPGSTDLLVAGVKSVRRSDDVYQVFRVR